MALDQHAANLVDTTVRAFNGDVAVVSPFDGISLIDSWTSTLRQSNLGDNPVMSGLGDLKAELQNGNPNGDTVQSILDDLADQVKAAADSSETDVKTKLTPLYEALQGFSQQLGGSSKMGAQNADALASDATATGLNPGVDSPMTSTVGGESTTSGVGVSSLSDDDDIASRIGGVTSITTESSTPTSGAPLSGAQAEDMDDSTGSDGGAQQASVQEASAGEMDGSLGGANQNPTEDTSDMAGAPNTGAASIGGMGVSGGSAESDS